jgi:DNA repair protein RadC
MEYKPDYLEHRKRLRERFLKAGAEALHDYESLELLLTYAGLTSNPWPKL